MIKQLEAILGKSLINNELVITEINDNELAHLFNTDYSIAYDYFKQNIRFYRGDEANADAFIAKSGIRASQGTTNVYNVLISNFLPSWKDAQKRSQSIIMTTSERKGKFHITINKTSRKLYYIFPKNDSMLTICPNEDMWFAFRHPADPQNSDFELPAFNYTVVDAIATVFTFDKLKKDTNTIEDMIKNNSTAECNQKIIKKINALFANNDILAIQKIFDKYNKIVRHFTKNDKHMLYQFFRIHIYSKYLIDNITDKVGIVSILDDILNFKLANFTNMSLSNFKSYEYPSNIDRSTGIEIWTESPCLFVSTYYLHHIEMINKGMLSNDK